MSLLMSTQRFCSDSDPKNILLCLKQNKNTETMDPKCKQMITKRQITQNTGLSSWLMSSSQCWVWLCFSDPLHSCLCSHRLSPESYTPQVLQSWYPQILPVYSEQCQRWQWTGGASYFLPKAEICRPGKLGKTSLSWDLFFFLFFILFRIHFFCTAFITRLWGSDSCNNSGDCTWLQTWSSTADSMFGRGEFCMFTFPVSSWCYIWVWAAMWQTLLAF